MTLIKRVTSSSKENIISPNGTRGAAVTIARRLMSCMPKGTDFISLLQKHFNIVGTLDQASAVVREAPEINPDVLILDISMGELNGFEITRQLRQEKCLTKIIFLTVHEELEFIRAAFDAGASGYVFKSRMHTDLRAAINAVQAGRVFLPRAPIPQ